MDRLVLAPADLNTMENNMEVVANELSGVVTNVNSLNEQMSAIEENVNGLSDEFNRLMKELKENTILNNARQSIIFNNEQINKKYGYFDTVRRKTISILDAINNSNINKSTLIKSREELLLNNPNYWLSNALASLISWILNDKDNCQKELDNALKKNKEKTSIFFCLVNLKIGRVNTAINWLNYYLNNEDPTSLNSDFVTVLDLVSNNVFGYQGKEIVISKINQWINKLKSVNKYEQEKIETWKKYILSKQEDDKVSFKYLSKVCKEVDILKNNLAITSTYEPILGELKGIIDATKDTKMVDEILNNLIYEYEEDERVYQKENLKNTLIIENNGDRDKAISAYEETVSIYDDDIDLFSLLTNVVIYNKRYKISGETRKFALSLIKDIILSAYDDINKDINNEHANIVIREFNVDFAAVDNQQLSSAANDFINNKYSYGDEAKIVTLMGINVMFLVVSILSIIKMPLLLIGILLIALIVNYYLIRKIRGNRKKINIAKANESDIFNQVLEASLAEYVDYNSVFKENMEIFEQLKSFLNSIQSTNFVRMDQTRNINIGE